MFTFSRWKDNLGDKCGPIKFSLSAFPSENYTIDYSLSIDSASQSIIFKP